MAKYSELLPQAFIDRMSELIGEAEIADFISSFDSERQRSISINTSKVKDLSKDLRAELGITSRIEWCDKAYYTDKDLSELTSLSHYAAGLFYLQEASATSPVAHMGLTEGMKVLDLCSSPGGKSLQIALEIGDEGFLLSNDISVSRQRATLRNIEKFGLVNTSVSADSAEKISKLLPDFFDAVLVDAPCSGEGMFAKGSAYIKEWKEEAAAEFHDIQLSLLNSIKPILRKDAFIMYSTCTFSEAENEGVIRDFLAENRDFQLEEIKVTDSISRSKLNNTYRIYPHKANGLGHFFCKLRKKSGSAEVSYSSIFERANPKADELAKRLFTDIASVSFYKKIIKTHYFDIYSDKLYAISKSMPNLSSLRLIRTNLLLGDVTKNGVIPSQHLAQALSIEECDRVVNLGADDIRRYLNGETMAISMEGGYVLVTDGTYPLGFAKTNGNKLKNLYKKDWVRCLRT